MADAIAETARLFQAEIGGGRSAQQPAERGEGSKRPAEPMFEHLGESLNPGEKAGGDPDGDVDYKVDKDGNLITDDSGNPIPIRTKKEAKVVNPDDEEEDEDEDEDADAEGEEGDEEEEEDPDEEDGEKDPALRQKYAILIDGEEAEVSVAEALKGYTRTQTFHKRMSKLSEASAAINTEAEALIADRKTLAQKYEDLAKEMESVIPPEPNWDEEYRKDPVRARAMEKQYQGIKSKIVETREKRDAAFKEATEKEAKRVAELGDIEFRKFAVAARWKNEKQANADLAAMRRTGTSVGFTDADIDSVIDSRMLLVLNKAAKYDAIMAAKPRPVKTGKTSTRTNGAPSAERRPSPTGVQGRTTLKPGQNSIDAAADVFLREISQPRRRARRG